MLPLFMRREIALARFWEKTRWVAKPHPVLGTPCREWTGRRNKENYGLATVDKSLRGKIKAKHVLCSNHDETVLAHRLAWTLKHGPIPDLLILHKCDNPPCVNDAHLFPGTHQDNADDKMRKNRHASQKKRLAAVISA